MTSDNLRRAEWEVTSAPMDTVRELCGAFHYARGTSNTAVFRHGLYRLGDPLRCWGVAVWLPPTRAAAERAWGDGWQHVLALTRLVCVPEAPRNAASFLLGRSIRLIRGAGFWELLLTFADAAQGHTGSIYRATGWEYAGDTDPSPVWIRRSDGRQVARKATRTRTPAEMEALGCVLRGHSVKHRFRMVLREQSLPLEV